MAGADEGGGAVIEPGPLTGRDPAGKGDGVLQPQPGAQGLQRGFLLAAAADDQAAVRVPGMDLGKGLDQKIVALDPAQLAQGAEGERFRGLHQGKPGAVQGVGQGRTLLRRRMQPVFDGRGDEKDVGGPIGGQTGDPVIVGAGLAGENAGIVLRVGEGDILLPGQVDGRQSAAGGLQMDDVRLALFPADPVIHLADHANLLQGDARLGEGGQVALVAAVFRDAVGVVDIETGLDGAQPQPHVGRDNADLTTVGGQINGAVPEETAVYIPVGFRVPGCNDHNVHSSTCFSWEYTKGDHIPGSDRPVHFLLHP